MDVAQEITVGFLIFELIFHQQREDIGLIWLFIEDESYALIASQFIPPRLVDDVQEFLLLVSFWILRDHPVLVELIVAV